MTFVTASLAIAGLSAASIPIIIHLLSRQRRKPIEWAAMRFLLEAMRKHRRRLRAEQILLLAVRCLIVVLFGAALARPLLTQAGLLGSGGERVVYLIVDNGLASGVTDDVGRTALEASAQQAIEIVRSLQPGDRVGISTTARPSRLALWPPTTDHGSAMNYIESLRPLDAPTDIAGALRTLRPALEEHVAGGANTVVYLLGELRAGSATIESPLPQIFRDLQGRVAFLASEPAQRPAPNVQVTSIDPVRYIVLPGTADGSGQITVRLERHGGQLERDVTRVRLSGPGIARTEPRLVRWEPGQSQASVDFIVGWTSALVETDEVSEGQASGSRFVRREVAVTAHVDDDVLNADNTRHAVLELREHLRVALLDRRGFGTEPTLEGFRSGQWVKRALEPYASGGGPVQITEVEPGAVSAADVRTADVVIATRPDLINEAGWAVLRQYVDRGGVLLVMPPGELNVHPWAERFLQAMELPWRIAVETRHHESGLFLASEQPTSSILRLISSDLEDLARPISALRTLPIEAESSEPLLVFADGRPMLVAATPGRAEVRGQRSEAADRREGDESQSTDRRSPTSDSTTSRGLVLYLASAPQLDWTNLPSKPLMVPLMHEIVRQSVGSVRAGQRVIAGERPAIATSPSARELVESRPRERAMEGARVAIDEEGRPVSPLVRAGVYEMRDAAGQPLATIAVNVDPRAGRTNAIAAPAAIAWLNGALAATDASWSTFDRRGPVASLQRAEGGSPIAWILLWIVLGLIVLETLLQRWFSHAVGGAVAPSRLHHHARSTHVHHQAVGGAA